jgi:plasmid stabilization system protein ParE
MKFRVNLLQAAERDVRTILEYLSTGSKSGATAWAKTFDKALIHLEESADSCPLAAEDEHVDFEVREILFKTRRGLMYRALFTLSESNVFILHVRGPGQDFVDSMEIREP